MPQEGMSSLLPNLVGLQGDFMAMQRMSTGGSRTHRSIRLLPLKRQLEWAAEHGQPADAGPIDPAFTATYGPLLSRLRARSLRDAHPVWEVFGKWLRTSIEVNGSEKPEYAFDLAWVLRRTVEAGVFFDGLDPVADVLLPLACDVSSDYFRVLVLRPSLLWALHVRPYTQHLKRILATILSRFPLIERDEDGKELEKYRDNMAEGIALVDLIQYMTKDEQVAYIAQLGLMIKNLDYYFGDMEGPEKNVAVEVFRENKGAFLTTLPTRHVALLLDYALHVHEVERIYQTLELLLKPRLKPALVPALARVSDDLIDEVVDRLADDSFHLEMNWCRLIDVLVEGERKVSEGLLRHFAENVKLESMFGSPMTDFPEVFEKLCRLSLEDEQVCQELIGVVWAKVSACGVL